MADVEREKKIASAKRKLRKFKQKKGRVIKTNTEDASSLASEEENTGGESFLAICENIQGNSSSIQVESKQTAFFDILDPEKTVNYDSKLSKVKVESTSVTDNTTDNSATLSNKNDNNTSVLFPNNYSENIKLNSAPTVDSNSIAESNLVYSINGDSGFNEANVETLTNDDENLVHSTTNASTENNLLTQEKESNLLDVLQEKEYKDSEDVSESGENFGNSFKKSIIFSSFGDESDNANKLEVFPALPNSHDHDSEENKINFSEDTTNSYIDFNSQPTSEQYPSLIDDTQTSSSATAEKLIQISNKLNGLAAEAQTVMLQENDISNNSQEKILLSELEIRNQQLAEQILVANREKQELLLQFEQLKQQMSELHHRLEAEKQQIYSHGINEQNTLRQQLQVQMQTISILVAEKQELNNQVSLIRSTLTQEQNSRQKYQDQLQDARLNIQKMERDMHASTDLVASLNKIKSELNQERDQLQDTLHALTKSNDENSMLVNELNQKLSSKVKECNNLKVELDDLHEKLSMAEVLLQQLSNTSDSTPEDQLKQLQEEREMLNRKLIEYQQAFQRLTDERELLSKQYEAVNSEVQAQVNTLVEQVAVLEKDNLDLQNENERLLEQLTNLEKMKEELKETDKTNEDSKIEEEIKNNLDKVNQTLENVTAERNEAIEKLQRQQLDNERLAKLNVEQEKQILDLNLSISESATAAQDHLRVLEQCQNDKATISRAVSQNKQLKQQLEEMQDVFVKLSNDKMELATELSTMEHSRNALSEETAKLKTTLAEFEETLLLKQQDIDKLQIALDRAQIHQETEKIQELDESALVKLRTELLSSQETVNLLKEQNAHLKTMVTRLQYELDQSSSHDVTTTVNSNDSDNPTTNGSSQSQSAISNETSNDDQTPDNVSSKSTDNDDDKESTSSISSTDNEDKVSSLSASIQQVEEELNELSRRYESEKAQHVALLKKYQELEESQQGTDLVSLEKHNQLARDMNLLQERFSVVMKEKVDALSKIEELEHINTQLQNECDTIGEYITLYHNQRQILKQRHHEKDEYVSAMAQEREQMQIKLEKLQQLVLKLINKRGKNESNPPLLTSSPIKNADPKNEIEINTQSAILSEWPDMVDEEDKPKVSHRPDLLPDPASLPLSSEYSAASNGSEATSNHFPGKLVRIEESSNNTDSSTASEIIHLLEQIQHPSSSRGLDFPSGFCLRYLGPYTAI